MKIEDWKVRVLLRDGFQIMPEGHTTIIHYSIFNVQYSLNTGGKRIATPACALVRNDTTVGICIKKDLPNFREVAIF